MGEVASFQRQLGDAPTKNVSMLPWRSWLEATTKQHLGERDRGPREMPPWGFSVAWGAP